MSDAPLSPPIAAGTRLGRYTIQSLLGSGAMGDVYRATDQALGRTVAVKLLRLEHGERDDLRGRFKREARAVAAINHPNVVQIFDIDEHQGRPYFVMEYLAGTDAGALLAEQGRLGPALVAAIGVGAARGLAAAATAGVIHRDVKPANLVITDDGTVKVTDFGLAKAARGLTTQSIAKLTLKGHTLGTPDYIPPEQARGDTVDPRADVYSLGGTLFHLLCGHPPYRASSDERVSQMEVIRRHLAEPVPRPSPELALPRPLTALVGQMLAKRPAERPRYEQIIATLEPLARPAELRAPAAQLAPLTARRPSGSALPSWLVGLLVLAALMLALALYRVLT